jgi:preprotein translocase subunit SecF
MAKLNFCRVRAYRGFGRRSSSYDLIRFTRPVRARTSAPGKYRSMPLRELIDLSINQTLGRTVATSLTVVLSILPLALIGGEVMRGFALAIIFGIIIGTSSSIFIASPILLFLSE